MKDTAIESIDKSITSETVKKIYQERSNFIIIGLTGRTGSGCTKVAEILSGKHLSLREPKKKDYKDSDERKYNVIYNYINADWREFTIIKMTNIIAYFIFKEQYKDLIEYLVRLNTTEGCNIPQFENLKNELDMLEGDFDNVRINFKDEMWIKEIPTLTLQLKNILKNYTYKYNDKSNDDKKKRIHSQLYTYLFQSIGNNIRSSGNPYDRQSIKSENISTLAEKANELIQILRKNNGGKGLFCIDAIRNPYEATYFKDRHAAFYLFSINTEDENRRKRLKYLDATEIKSLDEKEYPSEETFIKSFYHQNIRMCIELSDIHIYNPNVIDGSYYYLTEQLAKYVALIKHPGLITPTRVERCMQLAYNAKLNSGCLSRQVGAVITDVNYSTKAVGWNDVPEGQIPCNLRDIRTFCINKDSESYSFYEITDKKFGNLLDTVNSDIHYDGLNGHLHPYCFKDVYNTIKKNKDKSYTRSLHAEENAFLQITKYGGQGIKGGNLFTTASSCELCSKKAFQLGIKNIYYIDPYPGISENHILDFGNDTDRKPKLILFSGAIGSAYTSLYTQRIAYKDELALLTGIEYEKELEKCNKNELNE